MKRQFWIIDWLIIWGFLLAIRNLPEIIDNKLFKYDVSHVRVNQRNQQSCHWAAMPVGFPVFKEIFVGEP